MTEIVRGPLMIVLELNGEWRLAERAGEGFYTLAPGLPYRSMQAAAEDAALINKRDPEQPASPSVSPEEPVSEK